MFDKFLSLRFDEFLMTKLNYIPIAIGLYGIWASDYRPIAIGMGIGNLICGIGVLTLVKGQGGGTKMPCCPRGSENY